MIVDDLSKGLLIELSGRRRNYLRGKEYFDSGHVLRLEVAENQIRAKVRGSELYTVNLTMEAGSLKYDCDCPVGEGGSFCKHCVAAGLGALGFDRTQIKDAFEPELEPCIELPVPDDPEGESGHTDFASYFNSKTKEQLIELVNDLYQINGVYQRVHWLAAKEVGDDAIAEAVIDELDSAICSPENYYRGWAGELESAVYLILPRLKEALSPRSAPRIANACWQFVGEVDEILLEGRNDGCLHDALLELHQEAIGLYQPNVANLATRIFRAERDDEYGLWYECIQKYASILREEGLSHIRLLAEKQLAATISEDQHTIQTLNTIIAKAYACSLLLASAGTE
jgi:hypothetical protein